MLKKYFQGGISASKMGQNIRQNRIPYFLNDDDISKVASDVISEYTANLRRPYSSQILTTISEFIQNIGISYAQLNTKGAMEALGKKLMHGYLIDFFAKDGYFYDVTELLPEETCAKFADNFYYAKNDEDKLIPVGIYVKDAPMLKKYNYYTDQEPVLCFVINSNSIDNAIEFFNYIYTE